MQHARPADRQLEALAAHGLDQHRQLQLAAAGDLEGVAARRRAHPDRDIALGLAQQSVADLPRRSPWCLPAGSGLSLTLKVIARVGGSIGCAGSARFDRDVAERVGDGRLLEAGQGDDVPGLGRLRPPRARPRKARILVIRDRSTWLAVAVQRLDRGVGPQRPELDPAGQQPAEIGIGLERGGQHPERHRRAA